MKFRKRPVIIEAEQFLGRPTKGLCGCVDIPMPHVHTIHHNQHILVEVGDWIIPEPDGKHFYPCKADIFEKTYLPINALDRDPLAPIREVYEKYKGPAPLLLTLTPYSLADELWKAIKKSMGEEV